MKKQFFIISLVVLFLILGALVVVGIRSNIKNNELFADTDYPVLIKKKNGTIIIKLDGHRTPNLKWEVEISDTDLVQVVQRGIEFRGSAKFVIVPLKDGLTRVRFVRSKEIAGKKVNVAEINVPVYITNSGKLTADCLDAPFLVKGPEIIGENSRSPVLLTQYDNDNYRIEFISGKGDWTLQDPNGQLEMEVRNEDGKECGYISRKEQTGQTSDNPASQQSNEVMGTLSSQSQQITKEIKVIFNKNGTVKIMLN
ncbi:MAG: hypothetical protein K6B68_02890 [Eubacterium sp.]|nr:hypothetical protein [Eubacterium sp.]